jgi:hypothetical protein
LSIKIDTVDKSQIPQTSENEDTQFQVSSFKYQVSSKASYELRRWIHVACRENG